MNEPLDMRVCTLYLFRDGRFTSGAASVWPAESEATQKKNIHINIFLITEPYHSLSLSVEALTNVLYRPAQVILEVMLMRIFNSQAGKVHTQHY